MALGLNLYLSPRTTVAVGAPLHADCVCSVVHPFASGLDLQVAEFDHPSRLQSLDLVRAEDAVHLLVQALPGVVTLLPVVSATAAQIRAHLDTPLVTLGGAPWATALRASLEARGIDTDWADATTTARQLIRHLLRVHTVAQHALGTGGAHMLTFLAANIDATVGSLPAAVRTGAGAWLAARGVQTGWITGATTVRQVLRRVRDEYPAFSTLTLGGLEVF